ncbi:MAG: hypothetical protein IPL31_17550 [Saprospiraceae bacterium]|nr:hypothetical protein [Saprospiraceae bacterium]
MGFGPAAFEVLNHCQAITNQNKIRSIHTTNQTLTLKNIESKSQISCFYTTTEMNNYCIKNWMALNNENRVRFKDFMDSSPLKEKKTSEIIWNDADLALFLTNILCDHIRQCVFAFTGEDVKDSLKVHLHPQISSRLTRKLDMAHVNFEIQFYSNYVLPEWLGVGNGVSLGYGTIRRVRSDGQIRQK